MAKKRKKSGKEGKDRFFKSLIASSQGSAELTDRHVSFMCRSPLFKKLEKLRKELKDLDITPDVRANFKTKKVYAILKYPVDLKITDAQKGISYTAAFRDQVYYLSGVREKEYKRRTEAIAEPIKKRNKRIKKYFWAEREKGRKSESLCDEIEEKESLATYTVKKIVYPKCV